MIRSAYTAVLAAAFGALAIAPFREAVADQLWQPGEAVAVALTALSAGALALFAMAMRAPKYINPIHSGPQNPTPPTVGSGVQPARDSGGRFAKRA